MCAGALIGPADLRGADFTSINGERRGGFMVSAVCVVAVSGRTRRLVIGPRGRIDIYMWQDGRSMRYGMVN